MAARAAWLYYVDESTQAQIARQLYVSRQTVGRLLDSARERGIVRFEFDTRHLSAQRTRSELSAQLGLEDVIVVPEDVAGEDPGDRIAAAGAAYLRRFLHPGMTVAVCWGSTVARTLARLPPDSVTGITFASAIGGITSVTADVRQRALNLPHVRLVPAPVLVSSPELAHQLNAEQSVRDVLSLAEQAAIALTGVGSADPVTASSVRNGVVRADDAQRLVDAGAVGDMLGVWFDERGVPVANAPSDRRVGIALEHYRKIPRLICVAAGLSKVRAIRAACRGGLIRVLITDETTANALRGHA